MQDSKAARSFSQGTEGADDGVDDPKRPRNDPTALWATACPVPKASPSLSVWPKLDGGSSLDPIGGRGVGRGTGAKLRGSVEDCLL